METTVEKNKSLVREYINALFDMRLHDVRKMVNDNCVFHFPNITMQTDTYYTDDMIEFLWTIKTHVLTNGYRGEIIEMTAEDNRVATVVNGYALTIDNTKYNNRYHFLNYIENGLIVRHIEYLDSYLAAKVVGPILNRLS